MVIEPFEMSTPRDTGAQIVAPLEPPALRLEALVKRFGSYRAVRGIDLAVAQGEFLTILGPSGSGKTTILRMVAGFLPATSGRIFLNGRDVSAAPPAERGVGMVFQNYALFPHMTALDNVAYGLAVRGRKKADRRARAREVLELVGLQGMEERLPRQLSGGQQQRVALARALAFEPALLLMDEPLGALDRELRVRMAGELRRLHHELGATVVYVTHDREEALTLSDRIAVIREGLLESAGTPQDLYARPHTKFVASFFGGHNVLACERVAASDEGDQVAVRCLGQTVVVNASPRADRHSERGHLVIPGEALKMTNGAAPDAAAQAVVHSAVYMGNEIQVVCRVSDTTMVRVDLPGRTRVPPEVGTETYLRIEPELATYVAD